MSGCFGVQYSVVPTRMGEVWTVCVQGVKGLLQWCYLPISWPWRSVCPEWRAGWHQWFSLQSWLLTANCLCAIHFTFTWMTLTAGNVRLVSTVPVLVGDWKWQHAVSQRQLVVALQKKNKKQSCDSVCHPARPLLSGAKSTIINAISATWFILQSHDNALCG